MNRNTAERLVRANGWLAMQPAQFCDQVLGRSQLLRYRPGEVVYRRGDPPGGIYGLVCGIVSIGAAPADRVPDPIMLGIPGRWAGEGSFITGRPRMVELAVRTECWLMHLPLGAMMEMSARDTDAVRRFAAISLSNLDTMIAIVNGLQKPEARQRIAALFRRLTATDGTVIHLGQEEIGVMANVSRRVVNQVLGEMERMGLLARGYRQVTLLDLEGIGRLTEPTDR